MRLMVVLLSAAALLGQSSGLSTAQAAVQRWTPTLKQVNQLERMIKLPPGINPIAKYSRSYYGIKTGGRRFIKALYFYEETTHTHTRAGIVIVNADQMPPMVLDGGCNVVNVTYDVRSREVAIRCNGLG